MTGWRSRPAEEAARAGRRFAGQARAWAPALTRFTLTQILVQTIGALIGIVIVRALAKQQYAVYTVANTCISAFVILCNSGIVPGMMALGGRVWQDPRRLGSILAAGRKMRRTLAAVVGVPVLAALFVLLRQDGASAFAVAAILPIVLIGGGVQLYQALQLAILQLKGRLKELQLQDLASSLLRLGLVLAAAAIYMNATIALLITTLVSILIYHVVRRWALREVDPTAPADRNAVAELTGFVKRQWLNEVYAVFQGLIYLGLLSTFGSAVGVANYAAVTRIGLLFAVAASVTQQVLVPRYARRQEWRDVRRLHYEIWLCYIAVAAAIILFVAAFAREFLWILGGKYGGLEREMVLTAVSSALIAVTGITVALNAARGWFVPGWIAVPIYLGAQGIAIAAVGVRTLDDVIWVNILTNAAILAVNSAATFYFMRGLARRSTSP